MHHCSTHSFYVRKLREQLFVLTFKVCTLLVQDCWRKSCTYNNDEIDPSSQAVNPITYHVLTKILGIPISLGILYVPSQHKVLFQHLKWTLTDGSFLVLKGLRKTSLFGASKSFFSRPSYFEVVSHCRLRVGV